MLTGKPQLDLMISVLADIGPDLRLLIIKFAFIQELLDSSF